MTQLCEKYLRYHFKSFSASSISGVRRELAVLFCIEDLWGPYRSRASCSAPRATLALNAVTVVPPEPFCNDCCSFLSS